MLKLSKSISEYEEKDKIEVLWEEPRKYHNLISAGTCIISGRKGSGKSSVADYQKYLSTDQHPCYIIRPYEDDDLQARLEEVYENYDVPPERMRPVISKLVQYLCHIIAFRSIINGKANKALQGNLSTVYTFLAQRDLINGSSTM